MIEKNDIPVLDSIRGFKSVTNQEIAVMQNFINKYIDGSAHICRHCTAQIRHAWNRIMTWASNNSDAIEAIRNAPEPNLCSCGAELKDKRFKYCSDTCKNNKDGFK